MWSPVTSYCAVTQIRHHIAGSYPLPPTTVRTLRFYREVIPSETAVPFWGQTSQIPSTLSPKRDCSPKRVYGDSSPFFPRRLASIFCFVCFVVVVVVYLVVSMSRRFFVCWTGRDGAGWIGRSECHTVRGRNTCTPLFLHYASKQSSDELTCLAQW